MGLPPEFLSSLPPPVAVEVPLHPQLRLTEVPRPRPLVAAAVRRLEEELWEEEDTTASRHPPRKGSEEPMDTKRHVRKTNT